MRFVIGGLALVVNFFLTCINQENDRAKKHLQSDNYTVTWGTQPVFDTAAVLEIGDGAGHGSTLGWVRFQPGKDGVDVLSIELDVGRQRYYSKWPPDRAPVAVKLARLKPDAYSALLSELSVVASAELRPIERDSSSHSSFNFWVYARLSTSKTLVDMNWAGYDGSTTELEFAKPRAAVSLAREAIKGLDFQDHTLTDGEKAWASEKFARDYEMIKGLESSWWVRERYIKMIGVVGDDSALPVLRKILAAEHPNEKPGEA